MEVGTVRSVLNEESKTSESTHTPMLPPHAHPQGHGLGLEIFYWYATSGPSPPRLNPPHQTLGATMEP